MRFLTVLAVLLCPAIAQQASAAVATLGQSTQNFGMTGIGVNASGQGQSRIIWGTCAFDGTNTRCVLSGAYTGFGKGGAYSAAVSYPGNGPFPLIAVFPPGSDSFSAQAIGRFSFQFTLAESGGPTISFYSFANFFVQYTSARTCTGISNCSPGQVGLTPNATITGPVTGSLDPTPVIRTSLGVISASAFGGFSALAPGSWMEIYGFNLANVVSQLWGSADFNGNLAPTALGGTTVTIGGLPAYIDFVSPEQVNAQVPSGVGTGPQPVVVTTAGGSSVASTITVNRVQPGLLAPAVFKLPAGQYVAALFPDGVTFVLPPISGVPTRRAKPGDTIIFYGVGFGPVTPEIAAGQIVTQTNQLQSIFQTSFAGTPANVTFSGLTGGFLGLYQFNVVVPNVAASDSVPFTYSLGGVSGPQNLIIAVGN
jgi:uncharacterized protein (TIGR03437 family)